MMNQLPPALEEYVCTGAATDINGITWQRVGKYWATPEDADAGDEKFCKWYPTISEGSEVVVGGEMPIPPQDQMAHDAWRKYQILLTITESYIVEINGQKMRKGRYKK